MGAARDVLLPDRLRGVTARAIFLPNIAYKEFVYRSRARRKQTSVSRDREIIMTIRAMTPSDFNHGPAVAAPLCRVLIADDHDLFRETLSLYLRIEGRMEAVLAGSLSEAREILIEDPEFNVVLLDYTMPGMNGLEGLKSLQAAFPGPRFAVISGTASREIAQEALATGAAGFLPKTLSARSLVNAVRFIDMGEQYAPLEFMNAAEAPHPLTEKLSQRELETLRCLTEGKSNKEIARDLDIREPTVKLHLKTLFRKIGASNRTVAAMIAREQGLF